MKISSFYVLSVIIVAIFMLIMGIVMKLKSCQSEIDKVSVESNEIEIGDGYKIIDVIVNDKTHQYLKYVAYHGSIGLCHYPECKYCKKEIQK